MQPSLLIPIRHDPLTRLLRSFLLLLLRHLLPSRRHSQPLIHRRPLLNPLQPLIHIRELLLEGIVVDSGPAVTSDPGESVDVGDGVFASGEVRGGGEAALEDGVESFGFGDVAVDAVGAGEAR